jgi:hypothetical protein
MAKFLLEANAFVDGEFIAASVAQPVIRTVPDDTPQDHISASWKALDAAALKLLKVQMPAAKITQLINAAPVVTNETVSAQVPVASPEGSA